MFDLMKYPQKRNIILRTIKEYKDLFKNTKKDFYDSQRI